MSGERVDKIPTIIGVLPQYPDCAYAVDCGVEGEMGILDMEDGTRVRMLECTHPKACNVACSFNFVHGRKCPEGKKGVTE